MLPSYPPIAKRVVLDGGRYPAALQQPNVTVETTAIDAINASGWRPSTARNTTSTSSSTAPAFKRPTSSSR